MLNFPDVVKCVNQQRSTLKYDISEGQIELMDASQCVRLCVWSKSREE